MKFKHWQRFSFACGPFIFFSPDFTELETSNLFILWAKEKTKLENVGIWKLNGFSKGKMTFSYNCYTVFTFPRKFLSCRLAFSFAGSQFEGSVTQMAQTQDRWLMIKHCTHISFETRSRPKTIPGWVESCREVVDSGHREKNRRAPQQVTFVSLLSRRRTHLGLVCIELQQKPSTSVTFFIFRVSFFFRLW